MAKDVDSRVTIWNRTTEADGRTYILYFAQPDEPVHPSISTVQPIFSYAGSLSPGQSLPVSITSELFGVLCHCEGYQSTDMYHGRIVSVRQSRSIKLGTDKSDGTSLFVRKGDKHVSFDDNTLLENAPEGTFTIRCDAKFDENNHYAVGIGRKTVTNPEEVKPIILVRCVPNTTFTFRAIERFFVEYAPANVKLSVFDSTIIRPSTASRAGAKFDDSGAPISIKDDNCGRFWVNDKLCAAYGTADSSTPKQNGSHPTPSHGAAQASYPPPPQPSRPQNNPSPSAAPRESQNSPGPVPFHIKRFPEYLHKPADEEEEESDTRDNGFDLARLDEWDVVFVVDHTGTMRLSAKGSPTKVPKNFTGKTRWKLVCEALEYLADVTSQRNNNGIDVYFLLNKNLNKRRVKDGQSVLNQLQRVDLTKKGGTRFEPTLTPILHEYLEKLRKAPNNAGVRPLDIIVLTDGDAQDKKATNKLIRNTETKLELLEVPENQVGIQFVQVGEDEGATKWLKSVYDDHKDKEKRNIIDTRTYKQLDEADGDFGKKLLWIFLGAMEPEDVRESEW